MADIGIGAPPGARVFVTRKSRCASAMAFANPAFTPSSSPSNRNAMAMHVAVRSERTGLHHSPAQTNARNFMPIPTWVPHAQIPTIGANTDVQPTPRAHLYHLGASLFCERI